MSLSEVVLIVVIALFVLKPEELPTLMRCVRRLLRFFTHLSQQLKQELTDITEIDKHER